LWQYIVLGSSGNDLGHWSTGKNAWAAAGMLRVLGTLKRSVYAQNFENLNEINDLGSRVSKIHNGMYPHLVVRNPSIIHPLLFAHRPMQRWLPCRWAEQQQFRRRIQ
ncbi:hypothetical protein F5888DRAFT_1617759, partial [Russula emetica]